MTSIRERGPRVALIGDVGWAGLYHLGDEAMTEAALGQLRKRGLRDITIIAAEAGPASERYGVEAVNRFGFGPRWSRKRLDDRYASLVAGVDNGFSELPDEDPSHEILRVVNDSDAVLIAGGGNLTSRYRYHVYERSILAKLARHLEKPLFLSSQTIGPAIDVDDWELIAEILNSAEVVGVREPESFQLANRLTAGQAHVSQGIDDAFQLGATEADQRWSSTLDLVQSYAIASVSPYVANPYWNEKAYYENLSRILDAVSTKLDVNIYLIPHAGSPLPNDEKHDQISHARVVKGSVTGRIRTLPVMSATRSLAVMKDALLAVSTRYHPIVLGHSVAVPTISIGLDSYSHVRMHGAQRNFGTTSLHLPAKYATPESVSALAAQTVRQRAEFVAHVEALAMTRRDEASDWWDCLVSRLGGDHIATAPEFSQASSFNLDTIEPISETNFEWHNQLSDLYEETLAERSAHSRTTKMLAKVTRERDALKDTIDRAEADIESLRQISDSLRSRLSEANSRKAVRLANRIGDLGRKFRKN